MEEKREKELKEFQKKIGYQFKDINLLNQSLIHRSYLNENSQIPWEDNERLEFLGDAVLGLVISHLVMGNFLDQTEGELSKIRAAIVNEQRLAQISRSLTLGDYLLLGRGEDLTDGRNKNSILADAYEALFAAIYLDGGLNEAFRIARSHLTSILSQVDKDGFYQDYKSALQEYSQDIFKTIPKYILVEEFGPDHQKHFRVEVRINGTTWGSGIGRNKKEAEQRTAKEVLAKLLSNYNSKRKRR
jgi:ribonuclease III